MKNGSRASVIAAVTRAGGNGTPNLARSNSFRQPGTAVFPGGSPDFLEASIDPTGSHPVRSSSTLPEVGDPCRVEESFDRLQKELSASVSDQKEENETAATPFVLRTGFTSFICCMVVLNTAVMGFEADYPDFGLWIVFEHIFTAAFFLEMVCKIASLRIEYFHDKWNFLDGGLALLAAMDTWVLAFVGKEVDLQSLSVLRVLRMARLIRVLRLVKQFKRFVLIIAGVVDAIRTTLWVACVLGLAIYVCAIFCVVYIGRSGADLYPGFTKSAEEIDAFEIMENFNPFLSFGSMARSMLTLFNIAILAEWSEVIRPIAEKQPHMVVFFIMFVLFVTFGVMNVIIGMIVDNVMNNAQKMQMVNEQKEHERRWHIFEEIKELVWEMEHEENFISLEELSKNMEKGRLKALLAQVNLPQGTTPEELYNVLDENGDGSLSCAEFIQSFYRLIQNDDFQRNCMFQMGIHHVKRMIREIHAEDVALVTKLGLLCEELKDNVEDLRQDMAKGSQPTPVFKPRRSSSDLDPDKPAESGGRTKELDEASILPPAVSAGPPGPDTGGSMKQPKESNILPPAVSAGPPEPDAGYCTAFVSYEGAPSWNVPTTPCAENGTDAGVEEVAASRSRSCAPSSDWTDGGRGFPRRAFNSPGGLAHPVDVRRSKTDLKMQIHHAIKAARSQPGDTTSLTPDAVRLQGYQELAGWLDAICEQVQDAVWRSVRETFTEWLAVAEKELGEVGDMSTRSNPACSTSRFMVESSEFYAKGNTSLGL